MADPPRRTLKKNTLRGQPPPLPPVNPAIESWLAQVPSSTAKLTPDELRQWKLDDESHSGRGWFITSIALRVLSLLSAFTIAVIGLQLLPSFYDSEKYRLTPLIVPGICLTIWNAIEFFVVGLRHSHRGMPRRVHLPADGLICLLVAASIAGFWAGLYDDGYWYIPSPAWWYSGTTKTTQYIAVFVFLVILLLIHGIFFFFLLCSRQFRSGHHIPTPQIMYLPGTGEAVVVLARPYPPEPSHRQQRKPSMSPVVELGPLPATDHGGPLASPFLQLPTAVTERHVPESSIAESFQRASVAHDSHWKGRSLQSVPARKPLPGFQSTGTHYATPWPPDHVPDEAERARAARGEAQAQWMTLTDSTLDFAMQGGHIATDHPAREGEKSDIFRRPRVSAASKS